MKKVKSPRIIFLFLCISIIFYLGFKKHIFTFNNIKESPKYSLVINEVMINNRNSIRDEEGDFEGWIEIYNKGNNPINLDGFGLSNDPTQPFL
ncbi:hypothetical protein [Dethiothermospora halolimnae]|uniref:hypothetical protein n=1 Tax=Dethiothermospora halolimnae TaxID=3114390 RepID=UPI003CCB9803